MNRSLTSKILSRIIVLIIICTLSFTLLSFYQIKTSVTNQMKSDGATLINTIRREINKDNLYDYPSLQSAFSQITETSNDNIIYVSISDLNYRILVSNDYIIDESGDNDLDAVSSVTVSNYDVDMVSSATSTDENYESVSSATYADNGTSFHSIDNVIKGQIIQMSTGKEVYNVSTSITYGVDKVGSLNVGISLDSMNYTLKVVLIKLIGISMGIMLLAIVIGSLTIRKVLKPLTMMSNKVMEFADGDFTVEFKHKAHDEIGKMCRALETMQSNLKIMVNEIKNNANLVSSSSRTLAHVIEETSAITEGISKASEELAKGSSELAINSEDGLSLLNGLADEIIELTQRTELMHESMKETKNANESGTDRIHELKNATFENSQVSNLIKEEVDILSHKSEAITNITSVIQSIAEQTELLALNARIESAKAGEFGKGFSVVAEEIGKLSQQTSNSIVMIEELVTQLQESIIKTIEHMVIGSKAINKTEQASIDTMSAFHMIEQRVGHIIEDMELMIKGINQINGDKNQVVVAIEGISAIAQESTSSTEEIASSLEQQSMNMEQVTASAKELESIANSLDKLMNRFKL